MTSYLYDDANRIYSRSSSETTVYYSWDNNGNLIYDGAYSHSYDAANRLTTRVKLGSPSVITFYSYNGLGDRLQESIYQGATSTFTMDLNTGLTQVLSDGTNTYIYGLDRLAQVNTETEYFIGDALGSVRQMTDTSGDITYASTYNPYGVGTSTVGTSQTSYGFTNEYTRQKLVYLRTRYYSASMDRFLTMDTWVGNINNPDSLNRFNYAHSNPVMYTDPSRHFCLPCLMAVLLLVAVVPGNGKYTREQLLEILKNQIDIAMGRSKGNIPYWTVVNEPLESEPRMLVDKCRGKAYKWDLWHESIGPEYLDIAYQWAHEVDPSAKLIINENGADGLGRRSDDFYELIKDLLDRDVPIEGVGLQMHLIANYYVPSSESITANIQRFADLGLDVYITELDVTIDHEPDVPLNIRLERQARIYKNVVTVCLQEPSCKMIMFFNLSDADIWLREPTGLPDGLSMFDENFEPKPAYFAIRDALRNTPLP